MKKIQFGKMYFQARESTVPVVVDKEGRACPYVVLDSPVARKYAGLHLIEGDLKFAIDAMLQCRQIPIAPNTTIIKKSLWLSALVTYAKCYGASSGRKVTLNEKDCLRSATELQRQCHKDMLRTRHEYAAHAGRCEEEQGKVLLILHPDCSNKAVITFAALSMSAVGMSASYLDRCISVMRLVLSYVKDAGQKADAALRKAIDAEPLDKWYSRAIILNVSKTSIKWFPKHYIDVED